MSSHATTLEYPVRVSEFFVDRQSLQNIWHLVALGLWSTVRLARLPRKRPRSRRKYSMHFLRDRYYSGHFNYYDPPPMDPIQEHGRTPSRWGGISALAMSEYNICAVCGWRTYIYLLFIKWLMPILTTTIQCHFNIACVPICIRMAHRQKA